MVGMLETWWHVMSHYIIHTALSGATYCCVNANKSRTLRNVLVSLATHGILSSIEVGSSHRVMKKKLMKFNFHT